VYVEARATPADRRSAAENQFVPPQHHEHRHSEPRHQAAPAERIMGCRAQIS
jgi:hypothetical protein